MRTTRVIKAAKRRAKETAEWLGTSCTPLKCPWISPCLLFLAASTSAMALLFGGSSPLARLPHGLFSTRLSEHFGGGRPWNFIGRVSSWRDPCQIVKHADQIKNAVGLRCRLLSSLSLSRLLTSGSHFSGGFRFFEDWRHRSVWHCLPDLPIPSTRSRPLDTGVQNAPPGLACRLQWPAWRRETFCGLTSLAGGCTGSQTGSISWIGLKMHEPTCCIRSCTQLNHVNTLHYVAVCFEFWNILSLWVVQRSAYRKNKLAITLYSQLREIKIHETHASLRSLRRTTCDAPHHYWLPRKSRANTRTFGGKHALERKLQRILSNSIMSMKLVKSTGTDYIYILDLTITFYTIMLVLRLQHKMRSLP